MWSEGHRKQVVKTMEQDAFPKIGNKSITEITTPELLAVIRAVEDRDALDVASRISAMLFYFSLRYPNWTGYN